MSVLVVAEHNNQSASAVTLSAITAASQLSDEIQVLVAGHQCTSVVDALATTKGVGEILVADNIVYQKALAERLAPLIINTAKSCSYFIAPATTFGKNLMPRVAAQLDVGQVSDVIEIIDSNTYRRPIYAGNAIATVKVLDPIQVLTIRTTAFAQATQEERKAKITPIDYVSDNQQTQFISEELHAADKPELATSKIVVSGGRGMKDKATFLRLSAIAERLGAAIGASRAAVDAGLAPNDFQVGQTGQMVAPQLYFAVGISGAIQHVAGMKDSKIIVAINKDPDAPIFQIADYGLVGDINVILPQWEDVLTKLGY